MRQDSLASRPGGTPRSPSRPARPRLGLALASLAVAALGARPAFAGDLIYVMDNEAGGIPGDPPVRKESSLNGFHGSPAIYDRSDRPDGAPEPRRGDKALVFHLLGESSGEADTERQELAVLDGEDADGNPIRRGGRTGDEAWYGFSIFLPTTWRYQDESGDPDYNDRWLVVSQWHDQPDLDDGDEWKSVPLRLDVIGDRWKVHWKSDPDRISSDDNALLPCGGVDSFTVDGSTWDHEYDPPPPVEGYGGAQLPCWWQAPFEDDLGRWTDFVFHVKWHYDDTQAILQVWKNGEQVVNRGPDPDLHDGPVAVGYNDDASTYIIYGLYRSLPIRSEVFERTIYQDEYRMGGPDASYCDVFPGEVCDPDATCTDGIQNGEETGIDCGGACQPCAPDPTCDDGVQNGAETGIDCGGDCAACAEPIDGEAAGCGCRVRVTSGPGSTGLLGVLLVAGMLVSRRRRR